MNTFKLDTIQLFINNFKLKLHLVNHGYSYVAYNKIYRTQTFSND